MSDFDEEQLHRLVDEALSAAAPSVSDPARPGRRAQLRFGFGGLRLVEVLAQKLHKYLPEPDVQNICDELRSDLYETQAAPQIEELHALIRACRVCPAMDHDPVTGLGNATDPDLMVIHELPPRPGVYQDRLVEALTDAGIAPHRVWHVGLTRCDPDLARPVAPEERDECVTRYLFTEVMLTRPKLVLTLGAVASGTILGTPVTIAAERGTLHWRGPWAILPTYAPGYVSRRPEAHQDWRQDLQTAHMLLYGARPSA